MGKFKKRLDGNQASVTENKNPKVSTSLKRKISSREEEIKMKKAADEMKIKNNEKLKRLTSRKKRKKSKNAMVFAAKQSLGPADVDKELKTSKNQKKVNDKTSLRDRMMNKLQGARFRFLNEQMYTADGSKSNQLFKKDPRSFKAYHDGFQQQVTQWKVNPLDTIIANLKKKSCDLVVADFGCGDARLASSLPNMTVHSFDLVSLNDRVTACDMAHTPLQDTSVDIVVFCLSLMGTNLNDYLLEANRVLKIKGQLKIAEVESRFDDVEKFISDLKKFGFKLTSKNLSSTYFHFMDFKKDSAVNKKKSRLPCVSLKPCIYKKR